MRGRFSHDSDKDDEVVPVSERRHLFRHAVSPICRLCPPSDTCQNSANNNKMVVIINNEERRGMGGGGVEGWRGEGGIWIQFSDLDVTSDFGFYFGRVVEHTRVVGCCHSLRSRSG